MSENKRFFYDWKTGRMKDTQSNFNATSNMRIIERWINDACCSYEKKINELEEENKKLKKVMNELKDMLQTDVDDGIRSYPLKLSEYLVSALEKIGGLE